MATGGGFWGEISMISMISMFVPDPTQTLSTQDILLCDMPLFSDEVVYLHSE